jgi:GTP-binding protein
MTESSNIRNIAIIAHVDHGKTTLVDELLKQSGLFRENQVVAERVMDSMDLEREKGITIRAKNTSVCWKNNIINIVDTPGHADFGAEVERVMKMVDGVLLVVDALDGPQAQTRFVLKKALAEGLHPVVVINKIDRANARPEYVHDLVLELFLELHATEQQFNAPFVYGSARDGYMVCSLSDERVNMDALFETILERVPPPAVDPSPHFKMLISNIEWDDYVGRVAVGKVISGCVRGSDILHRIRKDGIRERGKVTKLFTYTGLATSEASEGRAGNIAGIAGFPEVQIGETLSSDPAAIALPFVNIDPPTIEMEFAVNDGPLAGQEGKKVTSRQISDRLEREVKSNVSIQVSRTDSASVFKVAARGAMQISVLVETMRREGYEVLVSRPQVIQRRDAEGQRMEPYETLWVETPDDCLGAILKSIAARKGKVNKMEQHAHGSTLEATITTRGLIGLESELMNLTSGRAVLSHLFEYYGPFAGAINVRNTGTLVSIAQGPATAYSLDLLESRGKLFVFPGETIYAGMIVGENPRQEDLNVNPTKEKHLTNVRSNGDGKGIQLSPPVRFSLERAIEYIADDEFVEATPKNLRLRKRILGFEDRKREAKRAEAAAESV